MQGRRKLGLALLFVLGYTGRLITLLGRVFHPDGIQD